MGFLAEAELDCLRIVNAALHIVGENEFVPHPPSQLEEDEFLRSQIRKTNIDANFRFSETSSTLDQIERIARCEDDFNTGAQNLSKAFAKLHSKTSIDGAFFIFELATDDDRVKIFSLIKFDYEKALEQVGGSGETRFRLITRAIVAGKRAVQKSALIKVVDGKANSSLSAYDRIKSNTNIGDYFAKYLDASQERSDEQLTKEVVKLVLETLTECSSLLPGNDVKAAFNRAKAHLADRTIDDDATLDAILSGADHPDDERKINRFEQCLRRKLKSFKLEGLSFKPNRTILRRPSYQRLETCEGVNILYREGAPAETIHREPTDEGGEIITICTKKVTNVRVLPENARLEVKSLLH